MRAKTDDNGVEMVLRLLSAFESVNTDGERSIVEIAGRVQAPRGEAMTLAQRSVGGHQEIGAVERGTVQAQLQACFLDVQERMKGESHSWNRVVRWCAASSIRKNKKLYARVSAGTIWRGCHGEDCRR